MSIESGQASTANDQMSSASAMSDKTSSIIVFYKNQDNKYLYENLSINHHSWFQVLSKVFIKNKELLNVKFCFDFFFFKIFRRIAGNSLWWSPSLINLQMFQKGLVHHPGNSPNISLWLLLKIELQMYSVKW